MQDMFIISFKGFRLPLMKKVICISTGQRFRIVPVWFPALLSVAFVPIHLTVTEYLAGPDPGASRETEARPWEH